jgi:tetratricopeptide (TPR) repeat protein
MERAALDTQGKNSMKKIILFFAGIFIIGFFLQSCNKRITGSSKEKIITSKYDSTTFDYIFTEAIKQKFLGNAGDALKYLEQCIKINPRSDAAYFEMAQIALLLSDQKNGKKFALKAASINEKNIWYLTLVANIYYQEKELDSAILFYEKAIKYFPEKENIRLNLAGIYSEKGQYEKATEIYSYFEKEYGVNEATSLSLIKILINSGDFKGAENKVKKLLEKSPDEVLYNGLLAEIYRSSGEAEKAGSVYRKLLENQPGNPQILLSISDFLINEKQYEDLFPILSKVTITDSVSREEKISLFSRIIGDSILLRSKSNEVEITLIVLEADNMNDPIIMLLRPEFYINLNKTNQAISRLEEIIRDQPENYYAWERVLLLYSEIKDWDKLLSRGKEYATNFNRSYLAKVLYASAALEKEQYAVAEEELRKAKILAGNDTDKIVQVLVMDADVLYRKKEYTKSYEKFKEALILNPEDVMILNNYAYYLAEQGQSLKEAEKMAKMVIEKEKRNTTYLDTYAWVLYKRGRFKEAQRIMEMVISIGEKPDAEWYEHLGYIMKALNKCEKAMGYWELAYKLDLRKSSLLKEIENCRNH